MHVAAGYIDITCKQDKQQQPAWNEGDHMLRNDMDGLTKQFGSNTWLLNPKF